jgi:sugar phosphate isomerase/epimerase
MPEWRYSVGEYTTPHLSFTEDLRVYRAAGAEGIGVDEGLKLRDHKRDLAAFKESGLAATFCFPEVSTILFGELARGPRDPVARVREMCEGIERMAAFDPVCCVCSPGPSATGRQLTIDERTTVVRGLRRAAQVAADLGVPLALEPMHSSKQHAWSAITSIPDAIDLLDEIDHENMRLLVDVWHLWDTPNVLDYVQQNASRIIGVHVDDWRSPTRSWCDRVLPGDGIGNAASFLAALIRGGYEGWLELEIFSDDGLFEDDFDDSLWKWDPEHLIATGRERVSAVWEQALAEASGSPK